ncbi:MAG: cohesin domain-containing protein [Maledivibacter sp.]|jgi:hypothetical protein|nr:cohesin domain-containing protein [Maledivibacter sp.]
MKAKKLGSYFIVVMLMVSFVFSNSVLSSYAHSTLTEKTSLKKMKVGDVIRANYKANAGKIGAFSNLGQSTGDLIPVSSSKSPDGDFYWIYVGDDEQGRMKLIADRNIQKDISWDALNADKIIEGLSDCKSYVQFNDSSYVDFSRALSELGNSDFTIEFYSSYTDTSRDIILGSYNMGGSCLNIEWHYGKIRVYPADLYSPQKYEVGKMYKITIAFRKSDGMHNIYVDDKLVASKKYNLQLNSDYKPRLGSDGRSGTIRLSDKLADFKIFNSYKTPEEIKNSKPTNSDVVLWYDFRNINNKTIIDSSVNKINATINGSLESVTKGNNLGYGTIRCIEGGLEWDKNIVNNTLNGKITAGDNNIWNWQGIYSLTSSNDNSQKIIRGNTSPDGSSHITSSELAGFRPVLLVEKEDEPSVNSKVLNIEPEKEKIKQNETVAAKLVIDNLKEIVAEDIRINYDEEKLEFLGFEEIEGMKLVKSIEKTEDGYLRVIIASKGESNIVNAKKILLKLKFKGIGIGETVINIAKGRVTDGIEMEKELTEDQCGEGTIIIEVLKDVNNSGEFTLLDLGIDARHLSKDPTSSQLSKYNTDIVVNGQIDDADLLEIGKLILSNPNYTPNK